MKTSNPLTLSTSPPITNREKTPQKTASLIHRQALYCQYIYIW